MQSWLAGSLAGLNAPSLSNSWVQPGAYGSVPAPATPTVNVGQNTLAAEEAQGQVYNQLPGYGASMGNIGNNIKSETAGQLPADVVAQIDQAAAERGVATGSPGSPNNNAALLRSLGLTSLDLTGRGESSLTSILPTLPGYGISTNPNFFPSSALSYEAQNQNNIYGAMPNPMAAAEANQNAFGAGVGAGGISGITLPGSDNSSGSTDAFMNGPWSPNNGPVLGSSSDSIFHNGQLVPDTALSPDQLNADAASQSLASILQEYSNGGLGTMANPIGPQPEAGAEWYGYTGGGGGSGGTDNEADYYGALQ